MDHFEYDEDIERPRKSKKPRKEKTSEKPSYRGRKPRSKYQRSSKKSKRATELISEEFFDDIYDEEADN